jgi:hypothetical protein
MEVIKIWAVSTDPRIFRVSVFMENGEGFPYSVVTADRQRIIGAAKTRMTVTVFADDELNAFQKVHSLVRRTDVRR